VKIKSAEFEISAVRPAQWPTDGLVEFAFVGRSNVGKSSLLNRLLGRKSLARVSQKPGKTQQINFFRINDTFRFADLPGYGYAAVSKTERAKFAKMMETYLSTRDVLARVFQLVDIRHSPMPMDIETYRWLRAIGLEVTIIATKSDKVGRSQMAKAVRDIRMTMDGPEYIIPVSAEKGQGIPELWSHIEDCIDDSADIDSALADRRDTESSAEMKDEHESDEESSEPVQES
jgi:GTP-binding protein